MRTKIRFSAIAIVLSLAAIGFWYFRRAEAGEVPAYRFATIERGSLRSSVSATGTLSAVRTVQVGTQVSGQVSAIHVDFNDKVRRGQLLARIDPTLQEAAVQDAEAQLAKARAQLQLARETFARNSALHDQRIITETEYQASQADNAVAVASVRSAEISLQRAKQNLSYTSIYSPIDGVIVERNVDVGQTVAASLSAPQLFLIANDLSRMQILASVDESDIGQICEGQPVEFSVQSYPNQSFKGIVRQVRLQSKTTDNVVNYTAVVGVENPDGKLLPGMTATVAFSTGSADDVMMVSNTALRFRPTPEMLKEAGFGASDTTRTPRARSDSAAGSAARPRAAAATLWHVDPKGKLASTRVRTGLSDGQKTEVRGPGLQPGMRVIVGSSSGEPSASSGSASPFQPQRSGARGPGGF